MLSCAVHPGAPYCWIPFLALRSRIQARWAKAVEIGGEEVVELLLGCGQGAGMGVGVHGRLFGVQGERRGGEAPRPSGSPGSTTCTPEPTRPRPAPRAPAREGRMRQKDAGPGPLGTCRSPKARLAGGPQDRSSATLTCTGAGFRIQKCNLGETLPGGIDLLLRNIQLRPGTPQH